MFLKSLELFGFKSFADKTEIVFEKGLTAIVGPNGCGKSNIVDAVRWALGEQSARTLRGGAMTDVIFNGGGRRGPLNVAEVTLAFDNEDRTLAIERDEVRVTRRLYRSGESEYLLNGKQVRLRDIRELLLDTGAGASAATFVEQGKIDALLQASAEERRHVLEEAAGIGKYKIRKHECLERLEEVSADRQRLGDLLAEVTARHEEVERQAEKAGKFVEVRDRLKTVRTELARHRRATLERRVALAGERAGKARDEAAREAASAAGLGEEAARLAEEKRARESAERRAELEIRDVAAALEGRRRQAEQEARRGRELAEDRGRLERALADADKRARSLEKEIEAGKRAALELREKDAGLGERVLALESRAAELDKAAAAAAAEVEGVRRDLLARMQEEAKARNRLGELEARAKVLAGREERLTRKRAEVAAALAEREAEIAALARKAAEAEANAGALEDRLEAASARRDEAERELRSAEEGFLDARRRHGEIEARLEALRALESEGEGLEPGVRAVLETFGAGKAPSGEGAAGLPPGVEEKAQAAPGLPPGVGRRCHGGETPAVIGPVADLLAVDRAHAAAIEAALGPRAQWILVRTREAALEILRWLASADRGRATLVPAEMGGGGPAEAAAPAPIAHDGFVGWAAELAAPRGDVRPLFNRMLEGTAIARDLEAALAIAGKPGVSRAVTLGGEVVERSGALEGGRGAGTGRIERVAERLELETQAAWWEVELHARRKAIERLRQAERAAADAVESLRAEHDEARLQAFSAKKEREERDRGVARVREEARLCGSELAEIAADLRDAAAALAVVEQEARRYREAAADLEARAAERAVNARAIEVDRAAAREELHDLKVRLARGAEQYESARQAAARAERELAENRSACAGLGLDLERLSGRETESRAALAALRAEAAAMARDHEEREARLAAARAELAALAERLEEVRRREAEAAAARSKADAVVQAAEREGRDAAVRLEELAARLREELSIELASLEPPPPPRPGEPPPSEAAMEREAASLRRRLEEIGPVNLEALEECDRLAERRRFLEVQTRDLEGAEDNLRAAIRKINETSRRLFLETFEAVRENFQQIFRKLFGGGKADLLLEEEKDVLEAGIEVTARPPGKEARTLSLLSGGEKVLTTVALLFAVFRSKPGPFCILDEVDAALDEHNIGRFVSLVREFLDRSQFLIVTHNKGTMKAADALYGVTMPEQGVSAPVSVRLAAATAMVEEAAAA